MTTSEHIIERLFGSSDRVPVFDRTAYSIPVEFWQGVEIEINNFKDTYLQYTTYIRLSELAREYRFFETFKTECVRHLRNKVDLPRETPVGLFDIDSFVESKFKSEDFNLSVLNDHLLDIFRKNGMSLHADAIDAQRKQRLGMKKRDIVREAYRRYEEDRTAKAFIDDRGNIEFPKLMVDRFVCMIYSDQHISYKKDIKDTINSKRSDFDCMILTDRGEYSKRGFLDAGYDKDEVDMFVPHNLEDEFNLIKNRSVLTNYELTSKPKKVRDGAGWAYLWQEKGVTYRFIYDPPKGRAVSLLILANMQVMTWQRALQKESNRDELQKAYDNDFLKEPNFIPIGHEHLYHKYESQVFHDLVTSATDTYFDMMGSIGFSDLDHSMLNARVTQLELCWNKEMPIDLGNHLWHRYDSLRKIGLRPELNSNTPLIHTCFFSDVDTGFVRFDHKEYRKSKGVFRNEIIFGNELKNPVDLHEISTRKKSNSIISDYFIDDPKLAKKYLYYKLHRRYDQINGISEHGYYDWRNAPVEFSEYRVEGVLSGLLHRHLDLPLWLKDVKLFDVLVDQEHLTRKFFSNLTNEEFRFRVNKDPLFTKTGHGRYRLNHPAVPEYRKVRDALTLDPEQVKISQS